MKFIYQLAYLFGNDEWETGSIPPQILETARQIAPQGGTALDLGCGRGQHAVALAQAGWQVVGIDFVPKAISQAKANARQADLNGKMDFRVGDVSHLGEMALPTFDFSFDMGCFHLLDKAQRRSTVQGLAEVMCPGGVFLLNAFTPRQTRGRNAGFTPEEIKNMFAPRFTLKRSEESNVWRFPSRWYWLQRVTP